MKKMISFCCVLILLAGVFAGCEKKPDEAQLALQAEWLKVLVFQDDLLTLTKAFAQGCSTCTRGGSRSSA